jgi:hypothetical protein
MNRRDGVTGPLLLTGPSAGVTLVEVMVALLLMAILLVPMAGHLLAVLERGRQAEMQADALATGAAEGGHEALWGWGARSRGAWGPGPVLAASVYGGPRDGGLVLGVWLAGWLVAERETEPGVVLAIDAPWRSHQGDEVVLRAREEAGAWGPPWRSTVPSVGGAQDPLPGAAPAEEAGSRAVVHLPAAGAAGLSAGSGQLMQMSDHPAVLPQSAGTVSMVGFSDELQLWWSQEGREVHVYF